MRRGAALACNADGNLSGDIYEHHPAKPQRRAGLDGQHLGLALDAHLGQVEEDRAADTRVALFDPIGTAEQVDQALAAVGTLHSQTHQPQIAAVHFCRRLRPAEQLPLIGQQRNNPLADAERFDGG